MRPGSDHGPTGRSERWRVASPKPEWLLVYVVVVPMLAVSRMLGNIDVIFPEAAALALGVLSLQLPGWTHSPLKLATVPPAFAAGGVALAHAGLDRWLGVSIALTGAAVGLQLVGSRLAPSLSAGVFPVVFGVTSWVLPLTVVTLCSGLAVVVVRRSHGRSPRDDPTSASGERAEAGIRLPNDRLLAAWATAVLWVVVAWAWLGLDAAVVAPPLVVAMLERTMSKNPSASTGVRHWAVLVVAATAGASLARWIHPSWIGGLLAVAVVLVAFTALGGPHPPALAICLIPQVAPAAHDVVRFVLDIALGAAVLYVGAEAITRGWRSVSSRMLAPAS